MKKLLPIVLSSALILSALSGCGSTAAPDPAATPAPAAASGETPAPAGEIPKGEPVTLTYVNKLTADDIPSYEAFFKRVSEAMKPLGYDLSFKIETVQSGTYSENLGLLLQSGNIPDLIYFQGGDYQFAVTQKILEDLRPYVDASPSVQASMNEFNKQRLQNYPYLLWLNPTTNKVPVVREDFFAKAPSSQEFLANPSPDNYLKLFKELKEQNATKYSYTAPGTLDELDAIFDQAFGNSTTWIKNADGTYTYNRVSENEKNKLDFYAKLYKEGLLDNEYLTKKWDTKEKAFFDGESAVIAGTQGKVIDLYNTKMIAQNGADSKIMVLPPAKGVAQGYSPIDVSKESRGYAISAYSKHKAEAFAFLEFLTTPEGQILDKLGEAGVQYEMVDNKIKLLPEFGNWYERLWGTSINFTAEFDPSTPFMSPVAVDSLAKVTEFGTADNMFVMPTELSPKLDAAKAIYSEYATDVVTGKTTTADFAKYVEKFMANGGKDITDYANQNIK